MDSQIIRGLATTARSGHLGTVSADGMPHVVVVCFAVIGETAYSAVDHKPKRGRRLKRVENIETRSRACLLVDHYDDDWTRLWWVRLDGRARVVGDPEERGAAVAALVDKYHQYSERPPSGPVLALDVERWSGWSPAQ